MRPEPASGLLVLVCVETGGEVDTGVEYTEAELAKARHITIHEECPFCESGHVFRFADARVIPAPLAALDTGMSPHATMAKATRVIAGESR